MLQYKGLEYALTHSPYLSADSVADDSTADSKIPNNKSPAYFGDEHAKLHPFRKLPVLIDGSHVIPETLAMAHYIDSKAGPSLFGEDALHHSLIIGLANMISLYAHQALMKDITLEFAFPKGPDKSVRIERVKAALPAGHDMLKWLSKTLDESTQGEALFFTGGRFSVCDAYLIPMLDYLSLMPEPFNIISAYPKLLDYIAFHRKQAWSEGILGKPNIPG